MTTRIVTQNVMGGIGNQMFIVANLIAYGLRTGRKVAINRNETSTNRPKYWDTIFHNLGTDILIDVNTVPYVTYRQPHLTYEEIPFYEDVEVLGLDGYFQNEKYFGDYKEVIQKLFLPSDRELDKVKEIWNSLLLENNYSGSDIFVALHVRRTDYITVGFRVLSESYYQTCTTQFSSPNTVFVIFSDDIEWCKRSHLVQHGSKVIYVDSSVQDYQCLYIMAHMCTGGVIMANSTFSWWGAYLGWLRSGKTMPVYCPKPWFSYGIIPEDHDSIQVDGWKIVNSDYPVVGSVFKIK